MGKSASIGMEQKQSLQQTQRLLMTPQMHQALQILQLPVLELSSFLQQEVEKNPALEISEDTAEDPNVELEIKELSEDKEFPQEQPLHFDDHNLEILNRLDDDFKEYLEEAGPPSRRRSRDDDKLQNFKESLLKSTPSLFEYLMQQAKETFEDAADRKIAELIIGNLDENGYLSTPLNEISLLQDVEEKKLRLILNEIQTFEPIGVGATSLAESLLIQLRCKKKSNSLAYKIINEHYDDLLHNRLPIIRKGLECTIGEIRDAVHKDIASLDLRPGASHTHQFVPYITADVSIRQEGENLFVEINDDILPPLRLNGEYFAMLKNQKIPTETREYIRQKITAGKWLLRSLDQRNDTLYRIASILAKKQREFISTTQGKLFPMTMKTIAEELQLHESTIARAVSNKYLACPRGLVPLRSFFTNAYITNKGKSISSSTVKELLIEILKLENKEHPWSDDDLSEQIKERGIECARRTIAKYRRELNIGSSSQRREY